MINLLKKISYNPFIIRLIRFLHLKPIARKIYYFLIKPKSGFINANIFGFSTKFYARDSDELRLVESVSGEWGEGAIIKSLLEKINLGDCILDVGASVGIFSIFFAKAAGRNGKVIAFEPEKESLNCLKENIKLNNVENIIIFGKAIGSHNQNSTLHLSKIAGNFSLIKQDNMQGSQQIEIVNGDEFLIRNNLPIPKLVKIDVEGYEFSVLEGLKNTLSDKNCRVLCCEIHPDFLPDGITEEKILSKIGSFGFTQNQFFRKPFFKPYNIISQKL